MNSFEQLPDPHTLRSWPQVDTRLRPRLIFSKQSTRFIVQYGIRSTDPEKHLYERQNYLLDSLANSTAGINIERAKAFVSGYGLRIAPFRLLNEADTGRAEDMGELEGLSGSYKASYDIALVPRHPRLEAINGAELTESILVHEFFHGANEHHDLVYYEGGGSDEWVIRHGRSGHRVYDCHGNPRGRLIEEANAERRRGTYVENILERPFGFTKGVLNASHFREGAAAVAAKYTILKTDGKPYVLPEAFVAQAFDLLCRVDPHLDDDLVLSYRTVEGLRNVAKRLEKIRPGLYPYMRDLPYGREHYRQCLIYVQQLVGLLPKQKAPSYDRALGMVGDEGLEPPTLSV